MKLTSWLRFFPVMLAILGLLMCVSPATAAERGTDGVATLHVPSTAAEMLVDGKLDERCWKVAARTGPLAPVRRTPNGSTTEAFFLSDSSHLYIGVSCSGKETAHPNATPPATDFIELLIDSNGDRNSYYLIRTDVSGKVTSSYREYDPPWTDRTWQPPLESAVTRSRTGWTIEFALPFDIFNKNKTLAAQIGFNIRRSGMSSGETHCWQGTFASPQQAGLLTGIPARASLPAPEYITRGLTRWYRPPTKVGREFLAKEQRQTIQLGPGSTHPGTTGEVRLELEAFWLQGDPHARGIIWDLAVNEHTGELYVLADTRPVRGVAELRVFDRQGKYLRTIMPLNPNLPRARVRDLCRKTAVEGGTELVIPKMFLPWGEPSMYGDWWHHPQKMTLAPNGDLLMANIYRGILWRMRPDGSLPAEGWTSAYNRQRNEPFESTVWTQESWHVPDLINYLPFHALHYPYFCFAPDGLLHISAGQGSRPTQRYGYHFEVAEENVNYHWPTKNIEARKSSIWKCRVPSGVKLERHGSLSGFSQPCGIVFDGDTLIVADTENNCLQVLGAAGQHLTTITQYKREEKAYPLHGPTALAIDSQRHLYVLIATEKRPPDPRAERTLRTLRQHVVTTTMQGPDKPTRLLKLHSWQNPKQLAISRPLDPDVLQIALDAGISPPQVWVANGSVPGSLLLMTGSDLSIKEQWSNRDETLSCPRQSGNQPILNIDPESGDVYVEDDSNYRLKQYGTVYRLDQKGTVLKTWPTLFFDARKLRMTSPWFTLDYELHYRFPREPLFIDSIFGKDGLVYRWKLGKKGVEILRFDRSGKPQPFRSTGTNALFVDPAMQANFWHDVYHGMDIDRHGNIFYVAKVDVDAKKRPVSAYDAPHRQINVYDAAGNLRTRRLLTLDCVRGLQVDNEGYLYVLHRPTDRPWQNYLAISKFRPSGGNPIWTRRWDGYIGEAQITNTPCHCTTSRFHQTLDGKGYLFAAGKYSVQVIDCKTGDLVGEFGSYGNMDCQGKGSDYPHPELPFGTISALSVWKDRLFVVDELNRRVVKCRIIYANGEK